MVNKEIKQGDRVHWVNESLDCRPRNIYGVTKLSAEHLCRMFHEGSGLPVVVWTGITLRPIGARAHHGLPTVWLPLPHLRPASPVRSLRVRWASQRPIPTVRSDRRDAKSESSPKRNHASITQILRVSRFSPEEDDGDSGLGKYNREANEFVNRRAALQDITQAHMLAMDKAGAGLCRCCQILHSCRHRW